MSDIGVLFLVSTSSSKLFNIISNVGYVDLERWTSTAESEMNVYYYYEKRRKTRI